MSLLERVKAARGAVDTASKFGKVADSLIGDRPRVEDTSYQEPDDYEEEQEEEYRPGQQTNLGPEYMPPSGIDMSEFKKDKGMVIDDKWLMSLAKMKVATLNLSMTLKTEPIRLLASMGFKYIDKPEIADQIKGASIETEEELESFNELLHEVVFQELKALQRADELRIPPAEELMHHRWLMTMKQMGGDGFSNVLELGEGLYSKFASKNGKK